MGHATRDRRLTRADVVKTRLQLQGTAEGGKPRYGGILDTLTSIVRNEGCVAVR